LHGHEAATDRRRRVDGAKFSHTLRETTMSSNQYVFAIEFAPGDELRAIEQVNGDLLVPCAARQQLELALLKAEDALPKECREELQRLVDARRLLGIAKPDPEKERLLGHLMTVAPI
jgi:hypothetical protein